MTATAGAPLEADAKPQHKAIEALTAGFCLKAGKLKAIGEARDANLVEQLRHEGQRHRRDADFSTQAHVTGDVQILKRFALLPSQLKNWTDRQIRPHDGQRGQPEAHINGQLEHVDVDVALRVFPPKGAYIHVIQPRPHSRRSQREVIKKPDMEACGIFEAALVGARADIANVIEVGSCGHAELSVRGSRVPEQPEENKEKSDAKRMDSRHERENQKINR